MPRIYADCSCTSLHVEGASSHVKCALFMSNHADGSKYLIQACVQSYSAGILLPQLLPMNLRMAFQSAHHCSGSFSSTMSTCLCLSQKLSMTSKPAQIQIQSCSQLSHTSFCSMLFPLKPKWKLLCELLQGSTGHSRRLNCCDRQPLECQGLGFTQIL